MGSARLLHPPGVAEVGQGQDRVVVETGDHGWCSANREAAASAETTWCLHSLVRRGAQQAPVPHDSTTGAIVRARDVALSLPPRSTRRPARYLTGIAFVLGTGLRLTSAWATSQSSEQTDSDRPMMLLPGDILRGANSGTRPRSPARSSWSPELINVQRDRPQRQTPPAPGPQKGPQTHDFRPGFGARAGTATSRPRCSCRNHGRIGRRDQRPAGASHDTLLDPSLRLVERQSRAARPRASGSTCSPRLLNRRADPAVSASHRRRCC